MTSKTCPLIFGVRMNLTAFGTFLLFNYYFFFGGCYAFDGSYPIFFLRIALSVPRSLHRVERKPVPGYTLCIAGARANFSRWEVIASRLCPRHMYCSGPWHRSLRSDMLSTNMAYGRRSGVITEATDELRELPYWTLKGYNTTVFPVHDSSLSKPHFLCSPVFFVRLSIENSNTTCIRIPPANLSHVALADISVNLQRFIANVQFSQLSR
jgi:hypothetical protein